MSVVSVTAKSFILALFIRDDGERFLLGDNGYDFKESQLHFAGNTIENDEVVKQGADGVILAGQVRRSAVQSFDGYVGDGTMLKETIEQMRRDFIAFFAKSHHFRVIYVDCNRNAWQRKGGYLVDAPEVKELWQIHPEYHVGLNFEDVNYYSYDEDADGNEILANVIDVPVSTEVAGGLEWDEDGAVSEDAGGIEYDTEEETATPAKNVYITDATYAPLASFRLDGETSQNGTPTPDAPVAVNTTTGENVVKICGKNLFDKNAGNIMNAYIDAATTIITANDLNRLIWMPCYPNTTYTISAMASNWRRVVAWTEQEPAVGVQSYGIVDTMLNNVTTVSITTGATAKYIIFRLWHQNSSTETLQQALDNLQIELGSTATTYEPYQEQSYEVNLGKNLFDASNANQITGQIQSDKTLDTSAGSTVWVRCEPNTTYVLSKINTPRTRIGTAVVPLDSSHNLTNYVAGTSVTADGRYYGVITSGAQDTYLYITYSANTGVSPSTINIQLEKGSTPTSYAAYFTPIELCKIGDYQDYIYKSGDKWYVRKEIGKYVYNNDLTGNGISSTLVAMLTPALPIAPNLSTLDGVAVSNMYGTISTEITKLGGTTSISCIRVNTSIDIADSYNAVKALAAANNLTIYYALATPTDTEITNEALVAQLETLLNTARTYAGVNNIFTVTPNEQGTLEISYYTKYQPIVTEGGYVWEAGGTGGTTTVVNDSIGSVNPIWKVYGPTINPVLENVTTGEQIEYIGTISEGQTLTIDMGEQTASLDGLNVISNVIGDYISLASGANTLVYSVTGEAGASKLGWSEIVG